MGESVPDIDAWTVVGSLATFLTAVAALGALWVNISDRRARNRPILMVQDGHFELPPMRSDGADLDGAGIKNVGYGPAVFLTVTVTVHSASCFLSESLAAELDVLTARSKVGLKIAFDWEYLGIGSEDIAMALPGTTGNQLWKSMRSANWRLPDLAQFDLGPFGSVGIGFVVAEARLHLRFKELAGSRWYVQTAEVRLSGDLSVKELGQSMRVAHFEGNLTAKHSRL